MNIRFASPADAAALAAIYAPYVKHTAISFEYDAPDAAEFAARIAATIERYPYLVVEQNGQIAGYAYAGAFHPRAAYCHGAEVSIYIAPAFHGQGIGRALYRQLELILQKQNVCLLYACIATTEREDEYLNRNSEKFHAALGFRTVAKFAGCGVKFGRWYDMIWMEKQIADRADVPFVPFADIANEIKL